METAFVAAVCLMPQREIEETYPSCAYIYPHGHYVFYTRIMSVYKENPTRERNGNVFLRLMLFTF